MHLLFNCKYFDDWCFASTQAKEGEDADIRLNQALTRTQREFFVILQARRKVVASVLFLLASADKQSPQSVIALTP
jgi:hypothetical protein